MVTRRYRVLERLGEGGCGRVYRCEMGGAGGFTKVVALKLLTESPDSDPEGLLKRLRDEARILGLLRHRAVVHADSLVLTSAGWATVMEYVEGVDLTTIERSHIPVRCSLEIVEEIASALEAAWIQPRPDGQPLNLIHRDIKPPNIRITLRGEVKLLDFGIARADLEARESLTQSVMLGTLKFMAPERLDGIEGPAGDIYSLGLVAARMLLGRPLPVPPRRAESHMQMLMDLRDELAVRLATDQPMLAADITRLVLRMLDYDPGARPSASSVAERCRALLRDADGPWLREWAPIALPASLVSADPPPHDPVVGTTLTEQAETAPRLLPKEPISIVTLDVLSSKNVILPGEDEEAIDPPPPVSQRRAGVLVAGIMVMSAVALIATARTVLFTEGPPVAYAPVTDDAIVTDETPAPSALAAPFAGAPEIVNGHSRSTRATAPAASLVATTPDIPLLSTDAAAASETPAPEAPVASKPKASTRSTAMAAVIVDGPDYGLELVSDRGRYKPGPVPAGTYQLEATFKDGLTSAGSLTLARGESVILKCAQRFRQCRRNP